MRMHQLAPLVSLLVETDDHQMIQKLFCAISPSKSLQEDVQRREPGADHAALTGASITVLSTVAACLSTLFSFPSSEISSYGGPAMRQKIKREKIRKAISLVRLQRFRSDLAARSREVEESRTSWLYDRERKRSEIIRGERGRHKEKSSERRGRSPFLSTPCSKRESM